MSAGLPILQKHIFIYKNAINKLAPRSFNGEIIFAIKSARGNSHDLWHGRGHSSNGTGTGMIECAAWKTTALKLEIIEETQVSSFQFGMKFEVQSGSDVVQVRGPLFERFNLIHNKTHGGRWISCTDRPGWWMGMWSVLFCIIN